MDHHALKLFLHLAESLHFSRTGRACHISPSALSRQIQRMEAEVGARLLERDNRSVDLTPAGRLFRDYAKTALEQWQALLDALAADQKVLKGEISFFCSVTASLTILPELLSTFKTAHPQVHIRLQTGDAGNAIRKVIGGEADIAVAALPQPLPQNLAFKRLIQITLAVIAPKVAWEYSDALKGEIPWDQVPIILSEQGMARRRIDAWFKQQKVSPNIYAQVAGNEAILSMVGLGCGVGIVPELVIENSSIGHRVTRLAVTPALIPYDVGLCVLRRKLTNRLIQTFWAMAS